MSAWLAVSALLGAGLLGLALRAAGHRRRAPALPPPLEAPPETTVLLPVRDEEGNVLACLDTLLAQSARPLVKVVDDGSTDATARLAAERAAGEPRLTLVPAGPLPPGWRGKVHALWAGSRGVESPWLLSTDADTRHHPELLARALAAAAERRLDAVSLAGRQEVRGPGEAILTPAVFALLDTLLGDWRAVASGGGPPVANGQFILLRREAWERCGGFETIREAVIDDVAVVELLQSHGHRTAFFRESGLSVRMYRGWSETARGWRRNLGGLFGGRPRFGAAVTAALLLPPAALAAEALARAWSAALLLWAAGAAASILFRAGDGPRALYGLLFPLDTLLLAGALLLGSADRRRGRLASWKGRELRV